MLGKIRYLKLDFEWYVLRNIHHIRSHKKMIKDYKKITYYGIVEDEIKWHESEIAKEKNEIKTALKNIIRLKVTH